METVIKDIRITEIALAHLLYTKQLVYVANTYTLNGNFRTNLPDFDTRYSAFDDTEIEKMHILIVTMLNAGMPLDVLFERIMGL